MHRYSHKRVATVLQAYFKSININVEGMSKGKVINKLFDMHNISHSNVKLKHKCLAIIKWFERKKGTRQDLIALLNNSANLYNSLFDAMRSEHRAKSQADVHAPKRKESGKYFDGYIFGLRKDFFLTREWGALRYEAIKTLGNTCMCCGRNPSHGVAIHVDHIKPRSVFPELALSISNLQILCEDCNIIKSNGDMTNWKELFKLRQHAIDLENAIGNDAKEFEGVK